MSDGARHVLLAFIAIVGGMAVFGVSVVMIGKLMTRWIPFIDKPVPVNKRPLRGTVIEAVILWPSVGVTAIFVFFVLYFW